MKSRRINCYWGERLGLQSQDLYHTGIFVVPHARPWPESFAVVFVREATGVISVGPSLLAATRARIQGRTSASLLVEKNLQEIFPQPVHHTVGPLYQGYAESEDFSPSPSPLVRTLSKGEHSALQQLTEDCDATEWEQSGIDRADSELFGLFDGSVLAAVAHYAMWAEEAASIGVLTHPDYRGRGYGRAVVSAAMQDAFEHGYLVLYQALLTNRPSVALAKALGCQAYAQTIGVHLGEDAG